MYDLSQWLHGSETATGTVDIRIALIHRSFRTVSLTRGIQRQRFAAHFPALGLLHLAQHIRGAFPEANPRHPFIGYFDEGVYDSEGELFDQISTWLAPSSTRILCLSTYTSIIDKVEEFSENFDPSSHLVVYGGAHVTLAPDVDNCHVVVRGEGSAGMEHIISRIGGPDLVKETDGKGLCFRVGENVVTSRPCFDRSIETPITPIFAYDLLPSPKTRVYNTNFTRFMGKTPQVYISTQSCKARCTFCSTYLIHGDQVARSPHLVLADLEFLKQSGYDSVEFHDDDLLQHPDFTGLLEKLRLLDLPWFCYCRADLITHEVANGMAAAGCRRVFVGVESLNQAKLDYLNKKTTISQNRQAVDLLHSSGIDVVAGFIIGTPEDTADSILAELDDFLQLPLYAINCSILSPDPGTVEFRRARRDFPAYRDVFGGNSGTRTIPNPEVYGTATPVGLPSVCRQVNKAHLNDFVALIDAEFYFREHIWNSMVSGLDGDAVRNIGEYYTFVREGLRHLTTSATDDQVRSRAIRKLKTVSTSDFWNTRITTV